MLCFWMSKIIEASSSLGDRSAPQKQPGSVVVDESGSNDEGEGALHVTSSPPEFLEIGKERLKCSETSAMVELEDTMQLRSNK
jgi:hypothetical protein